MRGKEAYVVAKRKSSVRARVLINGMRIMAAIPALCDRQYLLYQG